MGTVQTTVFFTLVTTFEIGCMIRTGGMICPCSTDHCAITPLILRSKQSIMENPSTPAQKQTTQQDVLSWQYIVLIVVIAAIVPLTAAAPITIARAERPTPPPVTVDTSNIVLQPLDDLELTETYDDPSGISIAYPTEWLVTPIQPGFFVLSNYPIDGSLEAVPADLIVVQFQTGPLESFTMPDGSLPPSGISAHDLMETLVANAPEPTEITDSTVDETPAASVEINQNGSARQLLLVTPNENTLVIIDSNTSAENWDNFTGLLENILANITMNIPAG